MRSRNNESTNAPGARPLFNITDHTKFTILSRSRQLAPVARTEIPTPLKHARSGLVLPFLPFCAPPDPLPVFPFLLLFFYFSAPRRIASYRY